MIYTVAKCGRKIIGKNGKMCGIRRNKWERIWTIWINDLWSAIPPKKSSFQPRSSPILVTRTFLASERNHFLLRQSLPKMLPKFLKTNSFFWPFLAVIPKSAFRISLRPCSLKCAHPNVEWNSHSLWYFSGVEFPSNFRLGIPFFIHKAELYEAAFEH